jgi:hypothetical protein
LNDKKIKKSLWTVCLLLQKFSYLVVGVLMMLVGSFGII